jgi:Putative MetA-pathway of phenol degradation
MRIHTRGAVETVRFARALGLGASLVVLVPTEAPAQMAGVIKTLFDQVTVNAATPNPANPAANIDHTSHFFLGGENLTLAVRQLNVAIAAQLASFPIASSSGGFTFSTNQRGEIVTTSTTFGPLFAERAVTIGRKQLNLGFTFQGTTYDGFDGQSLGALGGLRFVSEHNNCCGTPNAPAQPTDANPAFERDLLLSTLRADITTRTTAFFANYGVTNRFDVGLALPIAHVSIDARVDGEILRLGSGDTSTTHAFDASGTKFKSTFGSDSATGIGDILLRAKYNVYRTATAAFAGALDLRLPTGDKDDLLGTGATQAHIFAIASGEYGRWSPHVNFGYTFSSGETSELAVSDDPLILTNMGQPIPVPIDEQPDLSVPDEINYTFGVSIAATPRITVGFDVRGRSIRDVPRFDVQNTNYLNRGPGTPPLPTYIATNEFSLASRGNDNQVLGVIGGKFNLGGKFLLNASLLFALTDAGLKPKPTPVIGFDYVY